MITGTDAFWELFDEVVLKYSQAPDSDVAEELFVKALQLAFDLDPKTAAQNISTDGRIIKCLTLKMFKDFIELMKIFDEAFEFFFSEWVEWK